jgi:adenosylhomocysteine nucleosidase
MKKILLVFAMDEEKQAFLDTINTQVVVHESYESIKIGNVHVILMTTGVTMLNTYKLYPILLLEKPTEVIQVGTCAGLKQQPIGTVIHAHTFFNHDLDLTAFDRPLGWLWKEKLAVKKPILVSGSSFLASKEAAEKVVSKFDADGFDMESFGFYTICRDQGIPFHSIRGVSDNGQQDASQSFLEHMRLAANNAAKATIVYLMNL